MYNFSPSLSKDYCQINLLVQKFPGMFTAKRLKGFFSSFLKFWTGGCSYTDSGKKHSWVYLSFALVSLCGLFFLWRMSTRQVGLMEKQMLEHTLTARITEFILHTCYEHLKFGASLLHVKFCLWTKNTSPSQQALESSPKQRSLSWTPSVQESNKYNCLFPSLIN